MADTNKKEKREAPVFSTEEIGLIRKQIVEQILAEVRMGPLPMMRMRGYVQSEGKNYGSYTRD